MEYHLLSMERYFGVQMPEGNRGLMHVLISQRNKIGASEGLSPCQDFISNTPQCILVTSLARLSTKLLGSHICRSSYHLHLSGFFQEYRDPKVGKWRITSSVE